MNFLFVTPKYVSRGLVYEFNLGLAYVSSYMKHRGFNVFCLNPYYYDAPIEQQLSEYINSKQIDVICTGGMSLHFYQINALLEAAKKIKPEIITVVGGAIITSDPRLALENMQIDYGIIGEGEETMAELADALCNERDVNKVKGLAFFDEKNNLITTEHRGPISDLDALPIPDYEGFEYGYLVNMFSPTTHKFYYTVLDEVRPANIITSRSCPFNCTFCYHPLGKKYRQRSLDNVFREIDYLVERYNITLLLVMDELFSINKERMYEFAERIKKYNIKWIPQLRVSDVDEKVLKALKDSGVYLISYGIESLSDKILKSMQKKITKAQIEKALKLTRDAKIAIQGNILFGDPEETEETIKESIEWWLNHLEYGLNLSMIVTLPDASIYRYAIANGLIKDKFKYMKDGFPIINLTKLGDRRFKEICNFVSTYAKDERYVTTGKVIYSKKESEKHNGKNVFSIKIECPECHNASEYKNMTQYSIDKFLSVICRDCHMRLLVERKKGFSENYTLYNIIFFNIIRTARFFIDRYPVIRLMYYKIDNKYATIIKSILSHIP